MALSDLRNVDWSATLKLAALRGFASAIVLVTVGAVLGMFSGPSGGGVGGALRFLILWTFGASIGGVVYIWMLRAMSATLGKAVGIVVTVCSLMQIIVVVLVAAGDPLVYMLSRQVPQLLDLADFKVFNFVAVILVRKNTTIDVSETGYADV